MLFGHQRFLDNNTGLTIGRSKSHFIFNPDGVLSNNRYTVGYIRLESQPNGDATTEGQSVILKENSKMMVGFWLTNSAFDDTLMLRDCLNKA
ncbi:MULTISPECIES: hypothetical protein [Proteus]|uniref:hypothetical protein n=1 Tax=Proteus TaxID=583 RepID=UPI0013765671|nr:MULTISPECIES: hypothetical protein [Proteus]NBM94873.1 hypothetical protein [Proteus sp. G2662]NBN03712.1 hypothetical protein [Proteus sp. G2665]NBN25157.1 hypothetical protein [Proteus sp. G2657]